MKFCRTVALSLLLGNASFVFSQATFYLRPNDRVVFYGDSITQQGQYTSFVETYVVTHFPALNIRFFNSGWSGEWIVGGGGGTVDERLARDVVALKPTVATFMLGMNDAGYQDFDPSFLDVYSKGYNHLLDSLRQTLPDLRITLFQPSPFDDVTRPPQYALREGYNSVVVRFGQFVRELGQERHLDVVDMNAPLVSVLQKAHTLDPALTEKIIPDRIHPSAAGGLVMAAALLQSWNAPGIVTYVEIDAARGRALRSDKTAISELQRKPTLAWTQHDESLPLPLDDHDPVMNLVIRSSEVVESLDRAILKVTSLSASRYTLKIDGQSMGNWSKEDLAGGINLATLPTPMLKQSLAVHAITLRHTALRIARWQGVQVPLEKETSPRVVEALKALDNAEDDLLQQQRALAAPQPHRYELVPVTTQ